MEIVNPFILKNKAKMIKFLDELSVWCFVDDLFFYLLFQQAISECPSEPDVVAKGEPARELALVHTICELHKNDIINIGANRVRNMISFIAI